jgi:hypothetical protein
VDPKDFLKFGFTKINIFWVPTQIFTLRFSEEGFLKRCGVYESTSDVGSPPPLEKGAVHFLLVECSQ